MSVNNISQESLKTSEISITPQLKISRCLQVLIKVASLSLIVGIAVCISLFFLGLPLWVNITVVIATVTIVSVLFALSYMLLSRKLASEKKQHPVIETPSIIEPPAIVDIPIRRARIKQILHTYYSLISKDLPADIRIPNAYNVESYFLKIAPQFRLITAQAPEYPIIRDNEEGVCMVHFLPPHTSRNRDEPLKTRDLVDLRNRLSETCWKTAYDAMSEKQISGNWKEFIWESKTPDPTKDPQKLVLAWSPWGYYQEDIDSLETESLSPVPTFLKYSFKHSLDFFTKFFKDLMLSGISKICFDTSTVFIPRDRSNQFVYSENFFTENREIQKACLEGFHRAAKEITVEQEKNSSLPASFTLYLINPDKQPLDDIQ
ncbi:hypothetical protein [Chlamydia sp. 17-3921]|uniref:hypothetical protein n=1 Tax=Chlamydia sp. 17-3921 TaxID=2675798 RepID=UPI001918E057|nr:hypothetical protein [Chlamydia sp. 17-3921]